MQQLSMFDGSLNPKPRPRVETKYDIKKKETPFSVDIRRPISSANRVITVSGTGHRPDKLGGYHNIDVNESVAVPFLSKYLEYLHSIYSSGDQADRVVVISGMAQGWDTWLALAAIESKCCYLIAACPFKGQGAPWPPKAQLKHSSILELADEVVFVCANYDHDSMQLRNEYMVDNSDCLIAMHNGAKGGTKNCLDYAERVGSRVLNMWDALCLELVGL